MTDSPSSILLTREQSTGSNVNLWGGYLITTQRITEQAAKGYQTQPVTGDATISWTNYSTGNIGQCAHLKLTGSLAAAATLTFPAYMNRMQVDNEAGATVTIKCSGGTGIAIPNGRSASVYCDTVDYYLDSSNYGGVTTPSNNNDLVNYSGIQTLIANAVIPAASGTVLHSGTDTTAGYLGQKITVTMGGFTTTQLAGLTSVTLGTKGLAGNEKSQVNVAQGYVGGFIDGGYKNAQFTPVIGYAYDVDCSSAGVTVNLGGMTTPQVGQEIKVSNFGTGGNMYLLGTVNGGTNLAVNTSSVNIFRYAGSSWGWN